MSEYYEKNKERLKKQALEHYHKNKEKIKAERRRRKSWLKENGSKPKVRFDKAKSNARSRGKSWNLTFEEYAILVGKPCFYCDVDTSQDKGCGLDRIDNSRGYEPGNVLTCCYTCNTGRSNNFTPDEWKVAITAVLNFRKTI